MNHLGTLAMGSFLLATVQLAQIIMKYVEEQAKKGGESKVVIYIIKAIQCCLMCFERLIKFINKNAYIQCALQGHNFCTSCKDAFFLIFRNGFLFAIANGIGSIFIFLGRAFIVLATMVVMYQALTTDMTGSDISKELDNPYGPLFMILAISWITGNMFMSVWGMAADTILQCFCVDKELSNGKFNNHTPEQLRQFVEDPKARKAHEEQ